MSDAKLQNCKNSKVHWALFYFEPLSFPSVRKEENAQ